MNRIVIFATFLLASGCAGVGTQYTQAMREVDAQPCADLSSGAGKSTTRWSPRGGAVFFLGTDKDVSPRLTIGGYTSLLETDASRVDVALELAPGSDGDSKTNLYLATTGNYVYFLGEGTFFLKAGGGVAYEIRDDTQFMLGLMELGGGLWLPVGNENAVIVNASLQFPVGEANPAALLALSGGYEF